MKIKSRPGRASLVRCITASSALLFGASSMVVADDDDKINILRALVSPPVVSNGTIAGEPTEVLGILAVKGVDNGKLFRAISTNANFILVTGLSQAPITAPTGEGVQHGNYTISDDGDKVITVTPNGGKGRNGLEQQRAKKIGVKVVHIRPQPGGDESTSPFTNGRLEPSVPWRCTSTAPKAG